MHAPTVGEQARDESRADVARSAGDEARARLFGPARHRRAVLLPFGEVAEDLVDARDLVLVEAMMAGEEDAAAHHVIGRGVAAGCLPRRNLGEARLTQDVAGEHGPRLDAICFEMNLQIAARKRRLVLDRQSKRQPARATLWQLPRQDEPQPQIRIRKV